MQEALPTRYDHKEAEPKIYDTWEKSGYFNPDICVKDGITEKDAETFSMVLPPPNVTGNLHIGHAFEDTIQDIVVRFERMRGKRTLWVPGTDHAAIATEAKVLKILAKEEKKTKYDLGREEFLKRLTKFAQESHDTIVRQVKRMGASLDWSREAYTLDAARNLAVRTAFQKMYDLGLIYRGNRVVNWDPKGQTVISDAEVLHEEREALLYTFRYSKDFPIPISTTRPETKVGDTAVAVHPDDPRYKKFVGKEYDIEFVGVPLHIKVVADESVEKDFGTGALGVTPAHSMIDWELAQKHTLPLVQVIDERARMMVEGPLKGKKTEEARAWIVEELKKQGLIEKEEKIKQNISISERTGAIVEPLPKLQWFVAVKKPFMMPHSEIEGIKTGEKITLQKLMEHAASSKQVRITPERFEKIYLHWIENLKDWCISRQLWFGHRIPVWYCLTCNTPRVNPEIKSKWFLVRHGQSEFNKQRRAQGHAMDAENPLTDEGRAQATRAAGILKNYNIDLILSSDLKRTQETAAIIARATNAEVVFDKNLREINTGLTEGMGWEEREQKYGNVYGEYEKDVPGGESMRTLEERIWGAFSKHKKNHAHKNVAVVGHEFPFRMLLKHLKGMPFAESMLLDIKNAQIIELDIADACTKCGGDLYEQDPDTLDTWFSSGMWTFSTLGWPEKTRELAAYHPNSLMNPGYEILFLWVARMILMSGCLLGQIPFRTALIHGIVRDAKGRKFSKSLDNGIDPLDMADKYGADALRMALVVGAAPGNDVIFDEQKVKGYRNFSTKLWNVARFILMNQPEHRAGKPSFTESDDQNFRDLDVLKDEITKHLENFEFHLASEKLYHYVWHTFADKLIEAAKPRLKGGEQEKAAAYAMLERILSESLKMLHPFMPFVTEEIYGKFHPGKMLMVEGW